VVVQKLVILLGDNASGDDQDIFGTFGLQCGDGLGDEGLVAGRQGRDAEDVDVVLHGGADGFLRRLEEWAYVDVETDVGKAGGDDFRSAVVPVLAEFSDHDAWLAAVDFGELPGELPGGVEVVVLLHFVGVGTGDDAVGGPVAAEGGFESVGDFTEGGAGAGGGDGQVKEVVG